MRSHAEVVQSGLYRLFEQEFRIVLDKPPGYNLGALEESLLSRVLYWLRQIEESEPVIECCREWVDSEPRCTRRAEFLLWGKMLPPEALGPRCYDHAAKHVGHSALGDPAWAILDLRNLRRQA